MVDDRRTAAEENRTGHPDEETLAAYADGRLSPAVGLETERHLSNCPACRDLVSDAMAFLASEDRAVAPRAPRPFRRWQAAVGVVTGLAAAAALVLALRAHPEWIGRSPGQSEFNELVTAFAREPIRPAEGRLTGGFSYAPAPELTRGGPANAEISPDVRIAVARIEAAVQRDRSPVALWRFGVARLSVRDFDGAVAALEQASRADHDRAEFWSDLATAYLERGRHGAGNDDLKMALDAAERALTLNPALAEALFNRALALEALRIDTARAAWQGIAAAESDPGWAREAASHVSSAR